MLTVENLLPKSIHKLVIPQKAFKIRPNDYFSRQIKKEGCLANFCTNISAYFIFAFKFIVFLIGIFLAVITCNVKHIRYWLFTFNPIEKRNRMLKSCREVATLVKNKVIPDDKVRPYQFDFMFLGWRKKGTR